MNEEHAKRMEALEREQEEFKLQIEFNKFAQAHQNKQDLDQFI